MDLVSSNMNIMKRQLVQLKKQKFANIFILAKTFLINLFLESVIGFERLLLFVIINMYLLIMINVLQIQQMDMFRSSYSWYALSHVR